MILHFWIFGEQINLVLVLRGEAARPGLGRGDVTGLWATLGDVGPWSRLTVELYLTSLEKAKYRDPPGVEVLRTKGAWGTTLWRTGHSSGTPPRRGTADDYQRANKDPARRTIS